ncbi:uncharacterized protein LOC129218925 [Uloborus diversus]|uniref:uncharacterized protein LOC129218925 n=1 Tax=Uloborus diversus TaxID=327109 RepID=UPI00240A6C95|nr:uncharacterized protein LOC129218925 [Uloborus diversus]
MFPLCRSCTENMSQENCTHQDEDRALLGTWCAEELKLAIKKGYKVMEIYEVYHFESSTDSLFKTYIDLFFKIKQESSGWPVECVTDKEKEQYIRQYAEKEGVHLDPSSVMINPGRRQVAKLALNSFWGRWGMNMNKSKLEYVHTVEHFNKLFLDSTKDVQDVYFPTPEIAAIQYKMVEDFVTEDISANILLQFSQQLGPDSNFMKKWISWGSLCCTTTQTQ